MSRLSCLRRRCGAIAFGLATCAAAAPACAAVVSGELDFTASNFAAGAPYASVSGRVAYSFDNSAGFFNQADGATANGAPVHVEVLDIDLPGAWTPVLSYFTVFNGQPVDFFAIGHAPTTFVAAGSDDWRVAFNHSAGAPPAFREMTYATAGVTTHTFITFSGQVAQVPEPTTAALLAAGIGLLATSRRRRAQA